MTTLFFATDIHGSDICWNKFLNAGKFYGAEVLILGGDMTGKAVVPFLDLGGGKYKVTLLQQEFEIEGEAEYQEMVKRVRSRGYYPYQTTPDELADLSHSPERVQQIFLQEVLRVFEQWMDIAARKLSGTGIRVFVSPGNDDQFEIDEMIRQSSVITLAEGKVIPLNGQIEMISSGWSNRTPWNTYREDDEPNLARRYEAMIAGLKNPRLAVFNIHVPPYKSNLDEAPELDQELRPKYAGNALKPVGSTALRAAIEKYQPLLGLHGHIHEGRGHSRIGRTLCINPGSLYEQGVLQGALVKLGKDKVESYVLTQG
ncbi:MAG: metallophosphoesterase [Anaerolineae bacterium]|nr:MAG: metallophosphoesterase [Anaerolineae bacterium]